MKEIYTNKIFNWVLIILSLFVLIEKAISLFQEYQFMNVLIVKMFLFFVPLFSLISFFVKKFSKEFYSKLFLVINFIVPLITLLYHFLVDLIIYSISRTELISNPIIYLNFFVGILLFYLSIKFSKKSKIEQQIEYGKMFLSLGFFLILLNATSFYDSENFSTTEILIKFLISIVIAFVGNKLRMNLMKFKKAILFISILFFVYGLI